MNQSGAFVMRADKIGRDTVLAQIVQMVAQAQRSRAPIQRLADQVSGWFVPLVIAVAVARLRRLGDLGARAAPGLWPGRGGLGADHRLPVRAGPGDADVDHGRRRARRAGGRPDQERRSARAARKGRHAGRRQDRHADRRQADTLWRSSPRPGSARTTLLRLAASLERLSEHPLAAAIVRAAADRDLALAKVDGFESVPGKGRDRDHRRAQSRARQSAP